MGAVVIPTCSRCNRTTVLDPCRRCAKPRDLLRYPPEPDAETFYEMNQRLWRISGPYTGTIGSKDAALVRAWAGSRA